ncbi:hypothetical protein [Brevundimonas sp.]|uniref:hypothetical protein n=1 Tax=Brevundimonas sp. TaxID=1871086 RepID=UPI00272EFED2|nr:hypothetical protein [Brevundimonas sp.]MDP1913875.1 hypothetical protein [Brevundimonas sp.]
MSLTLTLVLLAAALGLAVFAGWRGSRPWDLRRGVRMIPWRFIMLLSGAAILILAIHLGTLMGVPQRPY